MSSRYPDPSEYVRALVSGRNRIRRERTLIAMLSQAFLDESGGLDKAFFYLGGYVGNVDLWTAFSDEWQSVLDRHGLPPLHMTELRNNKKGGNWLTLDDSQQHEVLMELVGVVARKRPQAFMVRVDMDDFRRRMPAHNDAAKWTYPYGFAACHLVGSIAKMEDVCATEFGAVEVVLDRMRQFDRSIGWTIEECVRKHLGDLAPRLGRVCWAEKDRDRYVPLQAADMLAWHHRRSTDPDLPNSAKYLSNDVLVGLMRAAMPIYLVGSEGVDVLRKWIGGWVGRATPTPPPDYAPHC